MDLELEQELYEKYTKGKELSSGFCFFTMGLPASGKTTHSRKVLKELNINPEHIIHLDPDDILEFLRQQPNTGNLNLGALNQKSIIIANKIFNKIIVSPEKYSVIYYGTGKNWQSYQTMINKAKKNGYKTGLINVELDLETAVERNAKRNRTVGRNVITSIHSRLITPVTKPIKHAGKTNMEILSELVDIVYTIDTSGNAPIISKIKGGKKKNKKNKNKKKTKKNKEKQRKTKKKQRKNKTKNNF